MAKKHISVTNDRVLRAMEESKNASKLIEDAILYYLESIDKEFITKEEVYQLIKGLGCTPVEIKNANYDREELAGDIACILDL